MHLSYTSPSTLIRGAAAQCCWVSHTGIPCISLQQQQNLLLHWFAFVCSCIPARLHSHSHSHVHVCRHSHACHTSNTMVYTTVVYTCRSNIVEVCICQILALVIQLYKLLHHRDHIQKGNSSLRRYFWNMNSQMCTIFPKHLPRPKIRQILP